MLISWFGGVTVCLWTMVSLAMVAYMGYGYLAHPEGDGGFWRDQVQSVLPIYLHIVGATIILLVGPLQMINFIWPNRIHRWTGVLYVIGCTFASLDGIASIAFNGTVGGIMMSIPFGIAGALTFIFPLITAHQAINGLYKYHKAWGLRTYALASSSVFYRVLYFGVYLWPWLHTEEFRGPIDYFFSWFYFLFPWGLVEIYLLLRYRKINCFYTPPNDRIEINTAPEYLIID